MSQNSPLSKVNEKFGGKDKLVDKLVALLESDGSKDDLRKKLLSVANSKLLRLHEVASVVKEKYGSRDKLIAVAAGSGAKDKDYVTKLESYSVGRLADVARAAERRAKKAAAQAKTAKPAAAAKPAAKKRAPKAKAAAKPAAKTADE